MLGEQVKNDKATNEDLVKALNALDELVKGKKEEKEEKGKDKEDAKDKEDDKKEGDKKVEKCSKCGKEGCDGKCKSEKSFSEATAENETISKAIEVSDFLDELVKSLGSHVDNLKTEINKSSNAQAGINEKLVVTLGELAKSMEVITNRLNELEKEPEVKKSITATAVDRKIAKDADDSKKLSKSEVAGKITEMVLNKSMVGGREITVSEVTRFETDGYMRDDLKKAILG